MDSVKRLPFSPLGLALVLTLLLSFPSCATGPKFSRFATPEGEASGLYLMRPNTPILALFRMDVDIYHYPGNFRNGGEILVRSVSLATGEYVYLRLPPGFYRLHLKNRDGHTLISALRPGALSLVAIDIFSTSFFGVPMVRLRDVERAEAAEILIDPAGRLHAHPDSEDFPTTLPPSAGK